MRALFFSVFVIVASAVLYVGHRYLWKRLVRDTEMRGWPRRIATAALIAAGVSIPLVMATIRLLPREYVVVPALFAFSWLGLLALLVSALAVLDLPRLGMWLRPRLGRPLGMWLRPRLGSPREAEKTPPSDDAEGKTGARNEAPIVSDTGEDRPENPGRRLLLARASAVAATAAGTGMFYIGHRNATGDIGVVSVEVPLPRLPKALDGLRVVQLSDVHIGPLLDGRFLDGVVEKVNALKPDLVVVTGDLVDSSPRTIGVDVARLGNLESRWGTYFCTGNHEYYAGVGDWLPFLERHGVRPLINERVSVGDAGPRGARFDLAGITDQQGGIFAPSHQPDLPKALNGRDPEAPLVLLAHRPNPIEEAAQAGVGLQLSGHTHGGQFFPITWATTFVHPYTAGLHQHAEDTWIYVSRGTGFWGPPIRVLAPAEITEIVLTA